MKISNILPAFFAFFVVFYVSAQVDPGTINLTHQWTFDDGTAKDGIASNPVDGVLQGGATIENNALQLKSPGQHLSFSASNLALNAYSEITQEIWFTSKPYSNTSYVMLSYFGNTTGGMGYNYVMITSARGDDKSRTCISDGTYNSEIFVDGPEYDDGLLHHMVSVINGSSVTFYIDGILVGETQNTIALSTIGNTLAFLGKGGYTSDPTWLGSIHKFSIYNKSLTTDEVTFLFQEGVESSPLLTSSRTSVSFDEFTQTDEFTLYTNNLTEPISITAPKGITVSPSSVSANMSNAIITVSYDGDSNTTGDIKCVSNDLALSIPVNVFDNSCFENTYNYAVNLISDPYVHDLAQFSGWGNRSINSDPEFVFCGSRSGKVKGKNGGSLDYTLTGNLTTNTTYRIKAKVFTVDGFFQMGMFGWSSGSGDNVKTFNTNGSWQDIDFIITTGNTLGAKQGLFFNNYGLSGTTGYIDNWEMYAVPKIYPSTREVTFITPGNETITVRGVSLEEHIFITPPQGITLSDSIITETNEGADITITYPGNQEVNAYLYLKSGNTTDSILINASVNPLITCSVDKIVVDDLDNATSFTVSAHNLMEDITINAPDGIILSSHTISSSAINAEITLYYDGDKDASGEITLTSGNAKASITLIASRNDACFTPLFENKINLIADPTCNVYTQDGWGNKGINSNPEFVFCGSRSGMVTNNGSYDRDLTGVMKTNTTYRVKAKVFKVGLPDNSMGNVTYTLHMDSASNPHHYNLIKEAMDSACYYFNLHTPFVENVRVVYNAGVPTAQASYHGEMAFGSNTRYMWVGTAIHELAHYFGSGTTSTWQGKIVNGVWTGPVATALSKAINGKEIHGDAQHYWPHGINQREEITNLGSKKAQEIALANAVKIIKAMVVDDSDLPTNNPKVGIGVYGYDAAKTDVYNEVTDSRKWVDVDFTFTSGATLKPKQGVYFNSGTGYIDNWEMYEINVTSNKDVDNPENSFKTYFAGDELRMQFRLSKTSEVLFTVYDIQGKVVSSLSKTCEAGQNNLSILDKLDGHIYLVKMQTSRYTTTSKVIR